MGSAANFENNWYRILAPKKAVYSKQAGSGTYFSFPNERKLHVLSSDFDLYIAGGTGLTVPVSTLENLADSGHFVAAGTQFVFHPLGGYSALGWITKNFPAAGRVTISIISG